MKLLFKQVLGSICSSQTHPFLILSTYALMCNNDNAHSFFGWQFGRHPRDNPMFGLGITAVNGQAPREQKFLNRCYAYLVISCR